MEEWKDVKGYENLYQVSNLGRVRSLGRKRKNRSYEPIILRLILKSTGYYAVSLHKNGVQKQMLVHRLVADAFCEREDWHDVIDHINTDTTDNRAENLRWTTTKGNVNNPISAKRRTEAVRKIYVGRYGSKHPKSKAVLQLTLDGEVVKRWPSASDAVRVGGFDSGGITHCCKGKIKYHKGYKWKYAI